MSLTMLILMYRSASFHGKNGENGNFAQHRFSWMQSWSSADCSLHLSRAIDEDWEKVNFYVTLHLYLQVTTTVQSMTEHVHQPSQPAEHGSVPSGSSAAQGRWLGLRIGFMRRRSSSVAEVATRMMKAEKVPDRPPDELPEKTADDPLQAAQDQRGASERAAKGGGS